MSNHKKEHAILQTNTIMLVHDNIKLITTSEGRKQYNSTGTRELTYLL